MKYPTDYVVFDIETTGFDGAKDKVTELGALRVVDGKTISTFNCLLNWDIEIPAKITEITHITKKMIDEEGVDPQKAINEFIKYIDYDYVIGHNVLKFDIPFIYNNFKLERIKMLPNYCFDTAAMFKCRKLNQNTDELEWDEYVKFQKNILGQIHYGVKYSVDTCCEEFKIDKSKVSQHRALGDCILTNEIFKHLSKK